MISLYLKKTDSINRAKLNGIHTYSLGHVSYLYTKYVVRTTLSFISLSFTVIFIPPANTGNSAYRQKAKLMP